MLHQFRFTLELFATSNALEFLSGKEIKFHLTLLGGTIILITRFVCYYILNQVE
jgi:hypothetical protein